MANPHRIECWADIENDQERKAVMAWVRASKFTSYSEQGIRVTVVYEPDPEDRDANGKMWGTIHFFEQYKSHGISGRPL